MMETEYATCTTAGCGNQGQPIPILRTDETVTIICGVCSQPITNVSATAPEPITEVPEWLQ